MIEVISVPLAGTEPSEPPRFWQEEIFFYTPAETGAPPFEESYNLARQGLLSVIKSKGSTKFMREAACQIGVSDVDPVLLIQQERIVYESVYRRLEGAKPPRARNVCFNGVNGNKLLLTGIMHGMKIEAGRKRLTGAALDEFYAQQVAYTLLLPGEESSYDRSKFQPYDWR